MKLMTDVYIYDGVCNGCHTSDVMAAIGRRSNVHKHVPPGMVGRQVPTSFFIG